jgi:hypothetical protein
MAEYQGKQGKFRRLEGKTIFIRSEDKKVTKGPEKHKGRRLMMKDAGAVTTAGMAADFGPDANVELTDGMTRRKKRVNVIKSVHEDLDILTEYMTALQAPEIEDDFEDILEKCTIPPSVMIKAKMGVWRRINGRTCFIGDCGHIKAGPKHFMGKKAKTLADELRAERVKK